MARASRAVKPADATDAASVRVYAWDASSRLDGLAQVSLDRHRADRARG